MTGTSRSGRKHLLAFLLFAGTTLAFTYPLITQMGTHFAGDNIDVWLNMWANWWTGKALREGRPFYYTTDILYPRGVSLYFHSFSHTNTALHLLLEPMIGPLAAYNTTVLLGFVLLGFGTYLLVHELTGSASAGFVAGLAATFAPYHVWECVHPNLYSVQYIPLLLWALTRLFRRPTWQRGVVVGLFCTLDALSGWHQPMYTVVLVGPYMAWRLVSPLLGGLSQTPHCVGGLVEGLAQERPPRWQLWRALVVAALVAAALVGPVVFPLLREQIRAGYAEPDTDWVFNTDVLALVTPSFLHPLWGDAVRPLYERFPAPNRPAFAGYVVLALALVGLPRARREQGWLIVATPLALVLALGTRLYVNGNVLVPALPWYDPIIGFIRTPIRLNMMLDQCLAILAGFGTARLLGGRKGWRGQALSVVEGQASTAALSALVLFEFLAWPFPTTPAYVPPFYVQLADEPGSFAIVEAPLDRQTDKYYMYWQTVHAKPLVNGHVSRPPREAFDFIRSNAVTRAFAERTLLRGHVQPGAPLAALAEANVRYIVIHKQFLPPELAADWIAALATRPVHDDEYMTVFATQPEAGVHFGVAHDFDGLTLSQAWVEPAPAARQFRQIVLQAPPILESHWSTPERRSVTVTLRAVDGPAPVEKPMQVLTVEPGTFSTVRAPLPFGYAQGDNLGKLSYKEGRPWAELPPGEYELLLATRDNLGKLSYKEGRPWAELPPGEYELLLATSDDAFTLPQRLVVTPGGWFTARLRPDAVWGEAIALRGVDWHRLANTLYVELQWEASQAPGADYKFFVHLLRADGTLAAQFDGMPRDWTYPTSRWEAGEQVADQAAVDLRDVPAGAYRLAIGWYTPDTDQRLAGVDASGQPLPESQLMLEQPVVIP